MERVRFQLLIASTAQWTEKNPVLLAGEIGTEILTVDGKNFQRSKTGDGVTEWNDLEYNEQELYPYTGNTTATVGGSVAGTNYFNQPVSDILNEILNPYIRPSISNLRFNNLTTIQKEVGETFAASSQHTLSWSLSTSDNVANDSTGTIWASENVVDEFGSAANKGNINVRTASPFTVTFSADYTKEDPGVLTFSVQGFDTQGQLMTAATRNIEWLGRIRFGVSPLTNLINQTQIDDLTDSVLSNGNRDYSFLGGGYSYICFPEFLNLTNVVFESIDVNTGAVINTYAIGQQNNWDASFPATVAYTNASGLTFNYKVYRSQFSLGGETICRAKLITT